MQAGCFEREQAKGWEKHKQVVGKRVSSRIGKGVRGMELMERMWRVFFFSSFVPICIHISSSRWENSP